MKTVERTGQHRHVLSDCKDKNVKEPIEHCVEVLCFVKPGSLSPNIVPLSIFKLGIRKKKQN